jgi:hypothetical protein
VISSKELEAWARFYDRGYNSFEVDDETLGARSKLDRALQLAYEREVQSGSISFRDFRREALKQMRAFLAKERRPPPT